MKFNAKLTVIAVLLLLMFSVSVVSANENITDDSSYDDSQVLKEDNVVSVYQDTQTTSLEATASDNVQDVTSNEVTQDTQETQINEYESSSDKAISSNSADNTKSIVKTQKNNNQLLKASNEDVLGNTIYVDGTIFQDIRDAIDSANNGDVLDLGGKTYTGNWVFFNTNKKITITNGVLNASSTSTSNCEFTGITFTNVDFTNFYNLDPSVNDGDCFKFFNSTLINCTFDNCVGYNHILRFISAYNNWDTGLISYCNFTNSRVLFDGRNEDNGQFIHLFGKATVDHCRFVNTSSNHHAGAICMDPVGAIVTNSYFENCSAWIGGAIYVHGHMDWEITESVLENCTFINCSATEDGGAVATNYGGLHIKNCNFTDNSAQKGAAIMIGGIDHPQALRGDNLHGHNIVVENCRFIDNVGTVEGGAVHVSGDNDTIKDCYFDSNYAVNGAGAAVYVYGKNASILNSKFYNHQSDMGTVYIEGDEATVISSTFKNNNATHGGSGVFIEGDDSYIDDSVFENNNAYQHGGAIHTIGDHATIINSHFYNNNAIPSKVEDPDYGLGGAIYIDGNNNYVGFSKFQGNTARNGSAIYTRGHEFHVEDDEFIENQAWSYFLFTDAQPPEDYWSEDLGFLINVTLVAGDNIINAIYNDGTIGDIYFHNVTYELSDTSLFNSSMRTTTESEIHPVKGVENSNGGRILYQDPREDNQRISLNITYGGSEVFSVDDLITNLYGNVLLPITKDNLSDGQFHPGIYTVTADHPEDMLYTAIRNSTTFRVLPHVDIKVTKDSNKDVYVVGEKAIFTITVSGVGTNATNVVVQDILPSSFKYVSATATKGQYDPVTNNWSVGFLPHLASETLTLTVQTTEIGTFDNVVIANCTERDWNTSNNRANKTIHVDLYYTKEASVQNTSAGETFEYYLRVFNTGDTLYTEVLQVRDILPKGIKYAGYYEVQGADLVDFTNYGDEQIWYVTNIRPNSRVKITVGAEALVDGVWNNSMRVFDYPPVNATVNVSSVADLHIFKDVQPSKVNKGEVVQWTITVINHGPSKAFGVYVKDILPAGLDIVGVASTTKGVYTRTTGIWNIGEMDVEERVFFYVNTTVLYSNANITNVAVVNSTTPDSNLTNNIANDTVESNPEGDVGVVKTVSKNTANRGDTVTWTITVTNYGPNKATGVVVTDKIPAGLDIVSSSVTKGKTYNEVTGVWQVGDLEVDESASLTIETKVTVYNTAINNVAIVNSTSVDTNPDNNRDDDYLKVNPEADLELVKVADKDEVIKGDIVTWTITVTNNGPNAAEDAYINDTLPDTLEFIDANHRGYDKDTGIWHIGHMDVGDKAVLIIRTKVLVSNDVIDNYAYVNASTYDPKPYNNDDDDDVIVKTEADVSVVKLVSNKTAHYGDTVNWTIIVTNNGPNTAENVILTDFIPEGLTVIGSPAHSAGHVYVDPVTGNGIWEIGNMENGESATCIMITTIAVTDTSIVNVVHVNSTSYDPDLSNNDAENRTLVPPEADVGVVKKVDNLTPNKFDTVTWTITVINHGPDVAKDVVVTDVLPAGLEYVSNGIPTAGSYSHNRNTWTFDSDLAVGERHTLTITTRVIDTGKITNEVNVTSSTYDKNLDNNYDNETIDVPAIADLEIFKEVSNKNPKFGELINWTITVTNNGPNNARNVVVNDKLPAGLIYVTHNATVGLYDSAQGIWQIGDLLHFDTVKLIVTTQVNITNATITNVAVVTSTTPDSNETNNKANNTTEVDPVADLAIDKTVDNHGPKKGDNITWIITVTNNGPDVAVNAVAEDILPEGVIYINSTAEMGSFNNDTGIWTIGNLANGQSVVLRITTTVNVTQAIITNTANVTSETPDPDLTNNEDNSTIDVGHEADLGVVKVVSNGTPAYGDVITWTITVTNNGPDNAVDVYVSDKLPNGLVYVNSTADVGKYNPETGIWTIGNLNNHSHVSLVITTLVNTTGNITNVAVVDSETHDPTPENNTDDDNITVTPMADLEVIKVVDETDGYILWEVLVINHGPNTAVDAYVDDVLPEGLIYDDSGATKGEYNSTTGIWTIGNMTNGEMAMLYIWTFLNKTSGNITNVAVVNSSTYDPNTTNNKDNDTYEIKPYADLEIIKLVSNKNPRYGEEITWTITVINNGPYDAYNVTVTDKLPAGLVFKGSDGDYDNNTGIWKIGHLAKDQNVSLVITTLVNITNATIRNVAVVNSSTPDNNTDNNKANNTTVVDPEADLKIIKLVSAKTVKKGDVITWTIVVTNNGPDAAKNVYVRDTFPAELTLTDYSYEKGIFDSKQFVWYINELANGETQELVLTATVDFTNKTILNLVNVTNDVYDPNETNNEGNNTTDVDPVADLAVVKEVSSSVVKTGEVITWTITVTNNGPDAAVNAKVTDKLPAGLIYQSDDSNGDYDPETGIWTIGDMANGDIVVLNIKALVNITNATITNVANVTSDTPDDNETNNKDNNTTTVEPNADLEIIKTVSSKTAKTGDVITWTITVTNKGPDAAINAKVTEKLPEGLIYNGHTADVGIYDPAAGVWSIGNMEKGDSFKLVISTIVNITNKTIVNVANVTSDTPDDNETNNKDNNTTTVDPKADLVVVKEVSNKNPKFGEIITWTVTVTNNGPDVAVNTRVTDKLPAGLIFLGSDGDYDASTGVWKVGDLAKGESAKLVITTQVNITNATIRNVANATSDTPGNDTPGNNTTVVDPKADLVVVKEVSKSQVKTGEVITWTITVTNNGLDTAVNTRVTDDLPDGLIYNGHKADAGNYDPSSGVWIVGDLAKGESKTLVISTIVNVTNKTIVNVANVTSDTPGNRTNGTNNTTSEDFVADIEVVKLVSSSTAKKGETVVWTIIVTNHGPDKAVNVNVTDKLPNGLTYSRHSADVGVYDSSKGIWIVGDMQKDDSFRLVIETVVTIDNGTIENIAVGNSSTPDNNTDNNKGNNTTTVNDDADLEIVKVVSNKNPKFGETITWTITVTNNGPSDAKGVKVYDKLPAGLIFAGANGNYNAQTGEWIVGDLANGKSVSLVITTVVNITNKTIINVANVTSDTPDSNKTNNEGNNTTDVDPKSDLVVVKEVSNKNPKFGEIITWTITVTNNGPDVAVNTRVTDKLPAGLIFLGSDGDYDASTGVWKVGDLAKGESAKLVITTQVDITNSTIRNVANATSDTPGNSTPGDNTTDVVPEADVEVIKLVSTKTTAKGEVITWTIVVTNKGPDAAQNVYVKDTLPQGVTYKAHTVSKGLFDSNSLTWYINALANGESQTLTIDTLVNVDDTTLVNNVNVTNDVYDPNETNNKANNTTVVSKELPADLEVVKVVSDANPHKGDVITWTITVTNNGPGSAKDVTVTDKLPAGLKFVSANGDYDKNTGVWTIGDLANGEAKSLIITTVVDITNANITNIAVVNSTTPDDNPDNNEDNETTEVDPEADVKVIKTVSNPKPAVGDTITWTVVVVNLGPDAAKDVTVEENLPDGLVLLSTKGSKGAYDNGIWTVGDMANGETATLTLTTKVTKTGAIENIVVANSTTYDPNKTNNKDKEVTTPKKAVTSADLEVIKVANKDVVKVGDKIIWTITVINHGPDKAINVRVTDWGTGDMEFISAKASKGSFDEDEGIWTIGDMEVGETVVLQITCEALSDIINVNHAVVESDTPDPNEDNNYDLAIVEAVNPDVPDKHVTPNPAPAPTPQTMHPTGNPIVMALFALLALAGVGLRRKI